jgi:hypothetical protein
MDMGVVSMSCGFCPDGHAHLQTRLDGSGDYIVAFYKCWSCGAEFTTTEIDEINVQPMFAQKRRSNRINKIVQTIKSVLNIKTI